MQYVELSVEYNGIVVYDPAVLAAYHGGRLAGGEDLFRRYTSTDEGDEVLRAGLVVPVLAIDDAGYNVFVRTPDEPHPRAEHVVHRNHGFALKVAHRPLVTDLYSLMDWAPPASAEYHELNVAPGNYRVDVDAFTEHRPGQGIVSAGYVFTFSSVHESPEVVADTGAYMRVLDQLPRGSTATSPPQA